MLKWLFDSPLPVGAAAPDFTLADQEGKTHTLSALRGSNVVLVFYPADETVTCRKQLCEFRDRRSMAESRGTVIFGISPQDAASHTRFAANHKFGFPLLVDNNKRVANLYNCGGPLIRRTVYLIGRDGRVRYSKRGKPLPEDVLNYADS